MIEDIELRNLFKIESAERLQHLDDGLLRLEKTPSDQPLLEDVFREAHSLKGAARMLGLAEIQTLAHQLEDALGAARKGAALLPGAVEQMNQKLAGIRRLVNIELGETEPTNAEQSNAEFGLHLPAATLGFAAQAAELTPAPPACADTADRQSEISNPQSDVSAPQSALRNPQSEVPAPQSAISNPQSNAPPSAAFRIESIRVDPKKLDALLTQAGELTVTKIRIARRLAEMDELLNYCEEWARALHAGHDDARLRLEFLQGRLAHLREGAYEDSPRLDFIAGQMEGGIRSLRLLPMSTLFMLFPRLVHELARELHKEVELVIEGDETVADKRVLEEMKDPLMHILRNSIGHGIESPEQRIRAGKPRAGTIRIKACQTPESIVIEVSDDGRGLDTDEIRCTAKKNGMYREDELASMSVQQVQSLILTSGFSTTRFVTDLSGRGVGLDVVRNNVERLKGTLGIESVQGRGLTLRAELPVSLATVRVLIVAVGGGRFALPVEQVRFSRKIALRELYALEGRQTVTLDGEAVSVAGLDELLGIRNAATLQSAFANPHSLPAPQSKASRQAGALRLPVPTRQTGTLHSAAPQSIVVCVVLSVGEEHFGLMVDELVDELEVVLKPQSRLLKRVRNVSGATILDSGEVCMVLNPNDLLKTLRREFVALTPELEADTAPVKKVLLLAEDSITTRTQEKRILEGAGYEVVTAVDGLDAYNKLGARAFDAVVSDINMPNMTGLALTEKIRADKKYAELPVILVTSLSSEDDQRRGLEAGANAYIAKPSFDQQVLLDCLARLI
ncbi:MAG: response regulator [Gallionella sp.]|nr:response regulator [Gallionella sp.]